MDDGWDNLLAEVEDQGRKSFHLLNQSAPTNEKKSVQAPVPPVNDAADEMEDFNPREFEDAIQVFDVLRQDNCVHEVAVPKSLQYTRNDASNTEMVKKFRFELDSFQSEAIECVNNYQSVLVSAHTSAGKTVVALYAVALALREGQRVIYTTPIKALSNQKYRELLEEFVDVGLMTGDVTLNPEASCLVMTTEILRSMLYRGSEIIREVGWVIFDEIHYMRDHERGVVWEETIILLPHNVHYVFLSATIPNAKQFAIWIANLHTQICHIIYTDYRPTPLQHVFYSSGSNGLYEVVNVQGEFREEQFSKAMSFINDTVADERSREGRNQAMKNTANNVTLLIRTIRERELLPCIVFSFSRKECEAYASGLKELDFNENQQKEMIQEIFSNAISLLSPEDQKLPQIKWILPYLLRGIGIHHSGLLPLLKECIEILFGEGLLKVLFATETFSMGLNMPARTVLFTSARKFDGRENRWINSGEYIQMSGRAGRRGIDEQGLVILMMDQKMSADVAKNIVKGHTDPLNSQFRLTYNMVLNLTRVSEVNPHYMMERSFRYFQNKALLPPLYDKWKAKKRELEEYVVDSEEELRQYNQLKVVADEVKRRVQRVVLQPRYLGGYFHPGRLFRVKTNEADLGWCALLEAKKKANKMGDIVHVLTMAVRLSWDSVAALNNIEKLRPPNRDTSAATRIIPIDLQCIAAVSSVRIKIPDEPNQRILEESIGKTIEKACNKFSGVLPELDPIKDMEIKEETFKADVEYLKNLEDQIAVHPLRKRPDFDNIYSKYERKLHLQAELKLARDELRAIKHGQFNEELECRQKVLRRMGYIDTYGNITQKGRIACEISAADEILLTEMLLTGCFNDMTSADAAALLSCFVFEEKTDKMPKLDEKLQLAFNTLVTNARKVAKVSIECKMEITEENYVEKLQNGIMAVVKNWCSGASFKQISEDSGIFEGSIIRCLRRLEELLREMISAVNAMGDTDLAEKFEQASKALKRDIVFAASLYL